MRLEDLRSSHSLSPREHRDRNMSAIMVASCREVNRHKSLASELSALSNYIYILYLPRSAPVRSFAAVYSEIYCQNANCIADLIMKLKKSTYPPGCDPCKTVSGS